MNTCGFVSGSKIFTFPPPLFVFSNGPAPPSGPQKQKTSGPRRIRSPGCGAATRFSILHFQRRKSNRNESAIVSL